MFFKKKTPRLLMVEKIQTFDFIPTFVVWTCVKILKRKLLMKIYFQFNDIRNSDELTCVVV